MFVLVAVALPFDAHADKGERALGFRTEALWLRHQDLDLHSGAGRATFMLEEGICDWVAARFEVGMQLAGEIVSPQARVPRPDPSVFSGLGSLGMVVAFDVLAWVPELYVGGGVLVGDTWRGRLITQLGVKRFINIDTALLLQLVGEWTPDQAVYAGAAFGMLWSID